MGITRFPHGVSSRGIPVIGGGGARFAGWWGNSYFVDYDHGDDGYDGVEATSAFKNPQKALDNMTTNDVVYIRNRDQDITSTDPEYIIPATTSNWVVTEAQTHISIIGASNVSHIPTQEGRLSVALKGSAGTAVDVLNWKGAFGLIENLAFHRGSSTQSIVKLHGNSTSLRAFGTVISNCLFRLYSQAEAAIYNLDNWFTTIYECEFHDCLIGIKHHGSSTTMRRHRMLGCLFRNQTAASVSTGILLSGSSGQDITIDHCDWVGEIPTGGLNTFITADAAIQGTISHSSFPADMVEGTAYITANGLTQVNCYQAKWGADTGAGGLVGS